MPRGELFVQLYVNYADDEKLSDVSRGARLLYVDALCKAKATKNDGKFTETQVARLAFPDPPTKAQKQARELVDTGAWVWLEDTSQYLIAAWLKRNKSAAQLEDERVRAEEYAAQGNHKRWHREERQEGCRYCDADPIRPESPPPSGTGSGTRSGGGWGSAKRVVSPETETETETKRSSARKRATPPPNDLPITDEMRTWAAEHAPDVRLVVETARMLDWARGKGESKQDWVATWRNWVGRAQDNIRPQRAQRDELPVSQAWMASNQ